MLPCCWLATPPEHGCSTCSGPAACVTNVLLKMLLDASECLWVPPQSAAAPLLAPCCQKFALPGLLLLDAGMQACMSLLVCTAACLLPHPLSASHLEVTHPSCRSMWTAMP